MPRFRCYCLTADDRIVWAVNVDAADLDAAIEAARRVCQEHPKTPSTGVEIWQDSEKLYVSPPVENSG